MVKMPPIKRVPNESFYFLIHPVCLCELWSRTGTKAANLDVDELRKTP